MNRLRSHKSALFCVSFLALVLVLSAGCAHKKKDLALSPDLAGGTGTAGPEETTTGEGLPDIDAERLLFSPASGLEMVYFDFDSYTLRPDTREALKRNAEKIRRVPNVVIQIEGHCDERGTQEYNLALGERRALAVREYLIQLGVSGDRMITISYGEEDPMEPGHSEAAWAKNRRCEFNKAQ